MPGEILRVTKKGQATVPKKYRDALNIKEGTSYALLWKERG